MTTHSKQRLTTWQEIATYFDVTIRTVQNWEKTRGLPVHRVPGRRSGVFAFAGELDEWQRGEEEPSAESAGRLPRLTARPALIAALLLLALAVWLVATRTVRGASRHIAEWEVIANELVVSDQHHDELWRHPFPEPLGNYDHPEGRPLIADLDGDGAPELLFVKKTAEGSSSDVVVCYDTSGRERWRLTVGRPVSTGTAEFDDVYRVGALATGRLRDGTVGTVVSSIHHAEFPTQILALRADGSVMGEYWHSGYIGQQVERLRTFDIDGDGGFEIYAGGTNNELEQATLVILDPETMRGASRQGVARYQIQGRGTGNELRRVLFPRSAVNLAPAAVARYNVVNGLQVSSGSLMVSVLESYDPIHHPTVLYYLRPDLSLTRISFSDAFTALFRNLQPGQKPGSTLDDEKERLRRGFRSQLAE